MKIFAKLLNENTIDSEFISSENQSIPDGMMELSCTSFLGRQSSPDPRDQNYLISEKLTISTPTKLTNIYWQDNIWWGNQGNSPMCVGYAWTHWFEDGPVVHKAPHPVISPSTIYYEAQKVDEWDGEGYDGTSVRGGAKYLQSIGKVSSYYWAFDIDTLISTVLNLGPVVVGTNWYYGMFFPDKNGVIRATGNLAGGHAYLINGVDTKTRMFRIKNSWGRKWGKMGRAFISFDDMARLINEDGEVCLAVENNF